MHILSDYFKIGSFHPNSPRGVCCRDLSDFALFELSSTSLGVMDIFQTKNLNSISLRIYSRSKFENGQNSGGCNQPRGGGMNF
jgi:hypothetical protein